MPPKSNAPEDPALIAARVQAGIMTEIAKATFLRLPSLDSEKYETGDDIVAKGKAERGLAERGAAKLGSLVAALVTERLVAPYISENNHQLVGEILCSSAAIKAILCRLPDEEDKNMFLKVGPLEAKEYFLVYIGLLCEREYGARMLEPWFNEQCRTIVDGAVRALNPRSRALHPPRKSTAKVQAADENVGRKSMYPAVFAVLLLIVFSLSVCISENVRQKGVTSSAPVPVSSEKLKGRSTFTAKMPLSNATNVAATASPPSDVPASNPDVTTTAIQITLPSHSLHIRLPTDNEPAPKRRPPQHPRMTLLFLLN
ncbi:hypothetical protein C8R44DRAFT_212686 [Mycena epipterygia]|nr:hypothetical protein C8R44DRAFT_212686 [Mycena epipterygia]